MSLICRLFIAVTLLAMVFGFAGATQVRASSLENAGEIGEIKSVVEAYFEARYQTFSTLQLDGFADLVSKSPAGTAAWQPELDKLEVELAHARLYRLRYLQYKFSLDYKNIIIDAASRNATLSLLEGHDVVFEITNEVFKRPVVSSMRNRRHTLVLEKEAGVWRVVSAVLRASSGSQLHASASGMGKMVRWP